MKTRIVTITKKALKNDAMLHLAAKEENALEIAKKDMLQIAEIIEETENSITFNVEEPDYSEYKDIPGYGSNKDL